MYAQESTTPEQRLRRRWQAAGDQLRARSAFWTGAALHLAGSAVILAADGKHAHLAGVSMMTAALALMGVALLFAILRIARRIRRGRGSAP